MFINGNIKTVILLILIKSEFGFTVDPSSCPLPAIQEKFAQLQKEFEENERVIKGLIYCFHSRYMNYGYVLLNAAKYNYDQAKEECNKYNGEVWHTDASTVENRQNIINALNWKLGGEAFWTGVTREDYASLFDGNNQIVGWCGGEPNSNNEGCTEMMSSYCLNDISCNKKRFTICQVPCS